MKLYKKRISAIVVLFIILVLCIQWLGYVVRPLDTDGAYSQIETFHELPDNSLEVIVYGSSHAFRGVDVMKMYEEFGIGAYNYSWHWQHMNTTKLFIKDSLLSQKPRVAVIETYYVDDVLCDTDMRPEIYYTRYLNVKGEQKDYLFQCFGKNVERYISYYVPLSMFHDNWTNLTQKSFNKLERNSWYREGMGYAIGERNVYPVTLWNPETFVQKELEENSLKELKEIVEICEQNDTEILFFTNLYEGEFSYSDALQKFADENGCAYLDLFQYVEEMGIDEKTDFSDDDHLNDSGAAKVASFIGEYLDTHYSLTDMRTIERNVWGDKDSLR